MNVVIYSRVSSQSARQSTDRQVADLQKLAADRGYTVCAVFEEKISGCKAIDEGLSHLDVSWCLGRMGD